MLKKLCVTKRCELLACKADLGKQDHIHLLVDMAPDIAVSRLVNTLKTITSCEIRKELASSLKPYYWKPVCWKRGYCSVNVRGATLAGLKQYIEEQGYDN